MSIYEEIADERTRAHVKHGKNSMEDRPWYDSTRLPILVEEVGEVARVLNEWTLGNINDIEAQVCIKAELIQVAAMAAAWADGADA